MAKNVLFGTLEKIGDLNGALMEGVRVRQQRLAKPKGALGRLEVLSVQLAGITGDMQPPLSPRSVIVCAADHGVAEENVSAYPAEVTRQMVLNLLDGGAAVNVLARQFGARVILVDVGVNATLPQHQQLYDCKIRKGTNNMLYEPAMERDEALTAVEIGIEIANAEIASGSRLLITGDIGIGNTTSSAAITSLLTGLAAQEVTGPGSGLGLSGWRRKCEVVEKSLALQNPNPIDPLDILCKIGGLEIAAITGVILAAAAARLPVLIDGFVSAASAIIASLFASQSKLYMIAGTCSSEPGHSILLNILDLNPLLTLDLQIGEGAGALLAIPLLEAAVNTLNEMTTSEEAQISMNATKEAAAAPL